MQRKNFFTPLFIVLVVLFFSSSLYAGWNIETIPVFIGSHSMKLDADGIPHVSGISNLALLHLQKNSSGWVSETLFQGSSRLYEMKPTFPTVIDIDSQGYPRIMDVYIQNVVKGMMLYSELNYLYKNSSGWNTLVLPSGDWFNYGNSSPYPPFSMSFKLDSNGNRHVAVFDYLLYGFHYLFNDTTDTTLIYGMYVGSYNSIAPDSSGYPHISYYDGSNLDLRYIYQDITGWHDELVDSTGDVGQYTSIRLHSNNNPHISYFDVTNGDLKYAYKDTIWHIETVDSGGTVGQYSTCSSLALDSSGNPHISYYDATNRHLKYAQNDGTGWHIETVDSADGVGAYSCIDLDSSNRPHITYARYGGVKYAVYDNQTSTTTSQLPATTTTTTPPTAIELSSFIAAPKAAGVILQWSTNPKPTMPASTSTALKQRMVNTSK